VIATPANGYNCKQTRFRPRCVKAAVPDSLRLEQFLPYRLSVLSNVVSAAIAAAYRQRHELTISEWRVIAVLARYPGLSAREVAEKTRMDAVAVSRAVTRLLRARRVRRATAAEDRRRSVLSLSEQGTAVYREVVPFALEYENALLAALRPAERLMLDEILDKLTDRAQRLDAPPAVERS
jgi:DNA-binding MarR family transcriptional regulator